MDMWERRASPVTHSSNPLQVTGSVYPQHLCCNVQSTIFALPNIRKPTTTVSDTRRIIAQLDL